MSLQTKYAIKKDVSKNELELNVIDHVRERPFLYDKSHKEYKDVAKKEKTWTEISNILDLDKEDESFSIWKAIRNQYMAFLRRLRNPPKGSNGQRPFFRHENAMAFYSEMAEGETYTKIHIEGPTVPQRAHPKPTTNTTPQHHTPRESTSHSTFSKKRKLDAFEDFLQVFKEQPEEKPDEFDSFGTNVACRLRRFHLKDSKVAAQLQFEIQKLLFEAELNLENESSSPNELISFVS